MVPVRADVEGDGSSASASADAGSSSTGGSLSVPAGGSGSSTRKAGSRAGSSAGSTAGSTADSDVANLESLDSSGADGSSAAPEGSTARPEAGLTAGDGSGHVAGGSDADGSAGSSPEGASSGQAETGEVLLNGLYPDFHTSGVHVHDNAEVIDRVLLRKREEAKRLADNARKAAEDAKKAADEMLKAAEELSEAVAKARHPDAIEDEMKKLTATVDAKVYEVNVAKSNVDEVINPLDWTYYSGFPNGWHKQAEFEVLEMMYRERKLTDNLMYYSGFPDGWHRLDEGALQDIRRYKIKLEAVEVKAMIDAKKDEIDRVKKQIDDLTEVYNALDSEIKKLEVEHKELENKLLGLDASLIKLYKADSNGNLVELLENTDFEKRKAQGDIRFLFKPNVECTLVKYGEHELWKKGERDVDVPKLVAFNDTVNVIAVRDDGRAVLFKKETSSDKWYYHNTIERKRTGTAASRTAAQPGSSAAPAPGQLSSGLSASKLELDATSTGTPETSESLNEAEETSSVASGEGSEPNEADSGTALRGSTGSAEGGSSSGGSAEAKEGSAGSEYSSVFMD